MLPLCIDVKNRRERSIVTDEAASRWLRPWPVYLAAIYFSIIAVGLIVMAYLAFAEAISKGPSEFMLMGFFSLLCAAGFLALVAGLLRSRRGAYITALVLLAAFALMWLYAFAITLAQTSIVYLIITVLTFAALIADPRVKATYGA
jgi:uncharacterized membrane protein